VEISRISIDRANLTAQETQKNLLQKVETVYQNVISGKSRYDAAVQQNLSAAESYRLSEEQFNLGMINTVELLKAKTQLLSAQKDLVQAKYSLILNKKILDFYMGQQISL
jgi:outer membrane protein